MTKQRWEADAASPALVIDLRGPFRVTDLDGKERAPRSAKAQGLIALLATSPNMSRTRIWLQDKLWSDRGKEQGAASLRQSLTDIRRAFGPFSDHLKADRLSVWLSTDHVTARASAEDGECLEGLDVRDPEFEDWLTVERQREPIPTAVAPQLGAPHLRSGIPEEAWALAPETVLIRDATLETDPAIKATGDLFSDTVALTLREALALRTSRGDIPLGEPTLSATYAQCGVGLVLDYSLLRQLPQVVHLRAQVVDARSNTQIWAGYVQLPLQGALPAENVTLLALTNEVVEAVADYLSRDLRCSVDELNMSAALSISLRQIFTMTSEGFDLGDHTLAAIEPRPEAVGLISAWRAHLRAIALVERQSTDPEATREEGRVFASQAARDCHGNSLALAALANARLILDGDVAACDEYSRQAIRLNPAAPLGWLSRSAAHLYSDQYEEAFRDAAQASALSGSTRFKFWWDFQRGLTAAMTGRLDQALDQTRRAAINNSRFRPSLRYLLALQVLAGDHQAARDTAAQLMAQEPDFSPSRMLEDPSYPASLLRKTGLIHPDIAKVLR